MAIGSLVCGFLSIFFPAAVCAIVFGHLSRSQIRKAGNVQKGAGLALAGLILGYLGLLVIPILIIAAIAIPNLLRARIAANETSAVAAIRTLNTAQVTYLSRYPEAGYACEMHKLGPGGSNENAADLIDSTLASGLKHGYRIRLDCFTDQDGKPNYWATAEPVARNQSGTRAFCSNADGIIRFASSGLAAACTSDGQPLE